jgi:maltose alpha-D-glucosyltransferase/alpha-amylase
VIDSEEYGYRTINVKKQQENPDSNLNWLKHLIRIRKSSKALGTGNITWLNQEDSAIPVLAYRRQTNDETIIMIHNMTENGTSILLQIGIYLDSATTFVIVAVCND